ncbi:CUB domain-containing protein 2 [Halotydeus destructor]|nr:CUB domain-containing protein 2 [Halotydeus destructor]
MVKSCPSRPFSVSKSGNFSSVNWPLNYTNNVRCEYIFSGQKYEVLNITFFVFDLEAPFTKGCLKDYIDISTVTAFNVKKLIGRYCGKEVPSPLLSMHPRAEIIFKSNHVVNNQGFHAMYNFIDESAVGLPKSTISAKYGCGGMATGSGGIIVSPSFPAAFPEQIDCMWSIRVRQDQHIYIKVTDLQLVGSIGQYAHFVDANGSLMNSPTNGPIPIYFAANCKDAQLAIYDGYENFEYSPDDPKQYCGDLKYYKGVDDKVELSATNRLLIRFKSDISAAQWTDQVRSKDVVGFALYGRRCPSRRKVEECKDFLCKSSEFCLNPVRSGSAPCTDTKYLCIDHNLVCNGLPNCSEQDTSDEDKCAISMAIGALAAAVITVVILIICCLCWCRSRTRKKDNDEMKKRKESQVACSSDIRLDYSDGSMQLRQLGHSSSTYLDDGMMDDLGFFPPPPPQFPRETPSPRPPPDAVSNCSIHGYRGGQFFQSSPLNTSGLYNHNSFIPPEIVLPENV